MSAQGIIIIIAFLAVFYAYHKNVKDIKRELIIAAIISFVWIYFSGLYNYRDANFSFLGLNLFPFVAWTAGLVALREIYEVLPKKNRMLLSSIIYIVAIIILEYVGYNFLKIQLASNYPGLFGFPLMHEPIWGQIYYLIIGPVYLLVTKWMKVK